MKSYLKVGAGSLLLGAIIAGVSMVQLSFAAPSNQPEDQAAVNTAIHETTTPPQRTKTVFVFTDGSWVQKEVVDTSPPSPYDVPSGTAIRQLISNPGFIVFGVEGSGESAVQADLRSVGEPLIDGATREANSALRPGETVGLGAIRNAGDELATVMFSSGRIVEIVPDEVIFTSDSLSEDEIHTSLLEEGWRCVCRCACADCLSAPQVEIPCGLVASCDQFNEVNCEYDTCTSKLEDCAMWVIHE